MNILVTGGAGFIGSHTVARLVTRKHRVRIFSPDSGRAESKPAEKEFSRIVEHVQGSVLDRGSLKRALQGIDAVFHFAAHLGSRMDFGKYFKVNVAGTAMLYELIVRNRFPIRKVIVASSQSVYGEGRYRCHDHGVFMAKPRSRGALERGAWEVTCAKCGRVSRPLPHRETHCDPFSAYALSKLSQERSALLLGERYAIPTIALRYSVVIGPGQTPENPYSGACRVFASSLLAQRSPLIYEDGFQKRDFVPVSDVVDANLLALEDRRLDGQVFNVGGGKSMTVLELYEKVARIIRCDAPRRIGLVFRYGDERHSVSDIGKLRRFGWRPKVSIDSAIAAYIHYLRKVPVRRSALASVERSLLRDGTLRPRLS